MPPVVGQKVFCTKYAISRGVEVCTLDSVGKHGAIFVRDGKSTLRLSANEWSGVRQEAVRNALQRIQKALTTMNRRRQNMLALQKELQAELEK